MGSSSTTIQAAWAEFQPVCWYMVTKWGLWLWPDPISNEIGFSNFKM